MKKKKKMPWMHLLTTNFIVAQMAQFLFDRVENIVKKKKKKKKMLVTSLFSFSSNVLKRLFFLRGVLSPYCIVNVHYKMLKQGVAGLNPMLKAFPRSTVYFPSHWLLFYITTIETLISCECSLQQQ